MENWITRYAPSPTGDLHIGGVRTALFCYLLAKSKKGQFIIRTDDTDEKRNNKKFILTHISILNTLGIVEDASVNKPNNYGPYLQSKRLSIYLSYAKQLIRKKKAYYCFCKKKIYSDNDKKTYSEKRGHDSDYQKCYLFDDDQKQEQIAKGEIPAIRFLNKLDHDVIFNDIVFETVTIQKETITNFIIIKKDGSPNYNFACVIDDYLMKITHVIRGAEHLPNTAKQVVLYQALKFESPLFAHVSLIINIAGKKLSKRETNNSITPLLNNGFLPSAIINYLAFLGWQPDKSREIFSIDELKKLFDLRNLGKSPAVYDIHKLKWFNKQYIMQMSRDAFIKYLGPLAAKIHLLNKAALNFFYDYFKTRMDCYSELEQQINAILQFHHPTQKIRNLRVKYQENILVLKNLIKTWFSDSDHELNNSTDAQNLIEFCKWKSQYRGEDLYVPLRLILNNVHHGMSLNNLILLLGRQEVLRRATNKP